MSWLVKAFTTCQIANDDFFLLLDPVSFYEMRHTKVIPEGTKLSKKLPPSDSFINDIILASVIVSPTLVVDGHLAKDINAMVVLKIGSLRSPHELYQRYIRLDDTLKRRLKDFKDTSLSQQYVISRTKESKLYRITESHSGSANLECYGSLKDITEKSNEMRKSLIELASKKTGRSYEAADLLRVENIHTYMKNELLPVDPAKIAFILRKAEIKPVAHTEHKWLDCFATLNEDASAIRDEIRAFHSMKWVQDFTNPYHQTLL